MVKAESSGEDPGATGGLVSNLIHRRVQKTNRVNTLEIVFAVEIRITNAKKVFKSPFEGKNTSHDAL